MTNKDRAVKAPKQLRRIARKKIRHLWERYVTVDEENEAWRLMRANRVKS